MQNETNLHCDGGAEVQALPVNARPSVEQLCNKRDIVQAGPAGDVVRADQGGHSDPLGSRDDQTRPAERCPLDVLLSKVSVVDLEVVVKLLCSRHRHEVRGIEHWPI